MSISAVYTQSGTVYDTDTLDSLKSDLVVTATYSDSSTEVVTTYTLSGTLVEGTTSTITVLYLGKTTTFDVDVESNLLYSWDFKSSIIDSVSGVTASLTNCSRSSSGVAFDSHNDYITLGEVFGFNRTMEIDFSGASAGFGNEYGIWFWTDLVNGVPKSGFGYRYNSNASNRGYAYYITVPVATWYYMTSAGKTYINGDGTLKLTIDSEGNAAVYLGDTQFTLVNGSDTPKYTQESSANHIQIGGTSTGFYNVTIEGVRIYRGIR